MQKKQLIPALVTIFLFTFLTCIGQSKEIAPNEAVTSLKCNEFTFDATSSHDSDNENLTYSWDFGDGAKSSEPVIKHIYNKSGDYKVQLTISDNSELQCSTASSTQLVRVNLPPKAHFTADRNTCTNQELTLDASGSSDDSGKPLKYSWDFGDGTKADQKIVKKTFTKGGKYKVVLTVDDQSGTVCNKRAYDKEIQVNAAPIADAGADNILKCVGTDETINISFDATGSNDENLDALQYNWDFGDGKTGSGAKITHKYEKPGNYDVKLVVKDNTKLGCGTAVDFVHVRINKAPQALAGDDIMICKGETVDFDGSKSFAQIKGTLNAKWNFGDNSTASGLKASHAYKKAGNYQATLTVENQLNKECPTSADTRNVTVNSVPTVSIVAEKDLCLGDQIEFDATSAKDPDGDVLEYYWSFGDGTILKGSSKATHKYKEGGEYRVTVIVDDKKKTSCSTATAETFVKVNTAPIADAGPNLACCVEAETSFDASASKDADGDALTYSWDFGDGSKTSGKKTSHIYKKNGTYNVTLTVDDNKGSKCSKSSTGFSASVNAKPVPIISIR